MATVAPSTRVTGHPDTDPNSALCVIADRADTCTRYVYNTGSNVFYSVVAHSDGSKYTLVSTIFTNLAVLKVMF